MITTAFGSAKTLAVPSATVYTSAPYFTAVIVFVFAYSSLLGNYTYA